MSIDFGMPEDIVRLSSELRRFAERELRPQMREAERRRSWAPGVVHTLDAFDIPTLDLPTGLGGVAAGALAKVVALEAVAWGDAGGLPSYDLGPAAAAAITCPDTETARETVAGPVAHEVSAHLVVRHPDDAAGREVRIDWAPGSLPARWLWVSDGPALLLFDMGEASSGEADAAAFHASAGVSLVQSGAMPDGAWMLSDAEALAMRGRARLWPAAVAVGIGAASLDHAVAYARDRVVAGRPVAHHQGNAFLIAEATARLEVARLAVRAAACRLDTGDTWAGLWATLAYLEAIDAAPAITDLGVQLLGGHGYVEDHPQEKWFRESRMLSLLWGGRELALTDAAIAGESAPDMLLEV